MSEERPPRTPREFDWLRSPESPVSMFMRKQETGKPVSWSGLKLVVLGSFACFWLVEFIVVLFARTSPWDEWTVKALAAILVTLVLDTMAALIPFPQILAAIEKGATGAGQIIANKAGEIRDKIVQSTERTRSGPTDALPDESAPRVPGAE